MVTNINSMTPVDVPGFNSFAVAAVVLQVRSLHSPDVCVRFSVLSDDALAPPVQIVHPDLLEFIVQVAQYPVERYVVLPHYPEWPSPLLAIVLRQPGCLHPKGLRRLPLPRDGRNKVRAHNQQQHSDETGRPLLDAFGDQMRAKLTSHGKEKKE